MLDWCYAPHIKNWNAIECCLCVGGGRLEERRGAKELKDEHSVQNKIEKERKKNKIKGKGYLI